MNNTRQKISRCFNKAAASYDKCSLVQQQVGDRLITALDKLHFAPQCIIDLGCGSGVVTELLARKFSSHKFYAIDIADQLLLQAKKRLSPYQIEIADQDFDDINGKFDLVFSNLALQWSLDLQNTINLIAKNLAAEGVFCFSIPLIHTFSELNSCSRNMFYSAIEIHTFISQAKLQLTEYTFEQIQYTFPDALSALKTIKSVGANHVIKPAGKGLKGKKFLTQLNISSLTYNIGYFVAKKI